MKVAVGRNEGITDARMIVNVIAAKLRRNTKNIAVKVLLIRFQCDEFGSSFKDFLIGMYTQMSWTSNKP